MKKILITSALPYVNNVPHLGNCVCVISADVYSRYQRSKGEEVIYVLGTDEHGTTTETRALKEGLTPKQICDKYAKIHHDIYKWFDCEPDCWGRSSSKENATQTVDIFKKLEKNGYILEKELSQAYCEKCKKFLSDRYILGECPFCGYGGARGDQCEKCGKLLDPEQLVKPKCNICGAKPIFKTTKHLFMDLPKIEPKLRKWIKKEEAKWSTNAKTLTQGWLKEGLRPRCITRDLKWGIQVPFKGYEDKVFYSWFDAPIGYIGITRENKKDWKDWWYSPKDTELVQFMGKDNIPFHTILFPSFLIGTGENYTLLNKISVNEYLNYEGGMFSKSKHVGVFGDDAMESGISADVFRYYIMVNRPEKQDTEFAWEDFTDKNNHELVGNFGNLVNRTLSFISRFKGGVVPKGKLNDKFIKEWKEYIKRITDALDKIELKKALREIMELSKLGNKFFQDSEPWKTLKENPEVADTALFLLANLVKDLAILMSPFLPKTADSINNQLNIKQSKWKDLGILSIKAGHKINEPKILFAKIDTKQLAEFKSKYSGGKEEEIHPLSKINLKVAEILIVEPHPDADKLYVMQIDIGKEKRQLVAGLRNYYKAEELKGKHIVIVSNLQPVKLRGKESQGMLLAAVKDDKVTIVEAPLSAPGSPVTAEGISQGDSQITYKEFKETKLTVRGKRIVSKETGALRTNKETLKVNMPDGASVE